METTNIYQALWRLDLEHNGCTVTSRDKDGNWILPNADIKLDEQNEASRGSTDSAPNPLFAAVNGTKLERPTYQKLIALLDNYIVNVRQSEDHLGDNSQEDDEIGDFLNEVLNTAVMQAALEYIKLELEIEVSRCELREHLTRLWFEIYTNYFNRIPVPFSSGFEHVFVGEGKRSGNGIGGYHSWVKFYLDEKNDRVDFRGFNYDGNLNRASKAGSFNPYVATISMDWKQQDMDGNTVRTLVKDLGGFFVGPSPELQLAIPTVAYFERIAGGFSNTNSATNKNVELQEALFTLVLYRSTNEDQTEGDHIRSFFPKFVKPLQSDPDTGVVVDNPEDFNDGDIIITKALVNPEGSDMGREWVEIENTSSKIIDLEGWTIADKLNRREPILGKIEPNKQRRIVMTRATAENAQLGNSGGKIKLFDNENRIVAEVSYGKVKSGVVLFFEHKKNKIKQYENVETHSLEHQVS